MDAAAAFDKARMLAARGETSEAQRTLGAVLAARPDHLGALLLHGGLLLEGREGEAALAAFERAVRTAPASAEALNGLARCLHALGRDDEALLSARRALAVIEEGDNFRHAGPVYLTIVWCLREKRMFKEALEAAEAGLSRTPDAVLAQWASTVEEELAEAQQEEC